MYEEYYIRVAFEIAALERRSSVQIFTNSLLVPSSVFLRSVLRSAKYMMVPQRPGKPAYASKLSSPVVCYGRNIVAFIYKIRGVC